MHTHTHTTQHTTHTTHTSHVRNASTLLLTAQVAFIESYLRANHLWRSYSDHAADAKIKYSAVLHLDLSTVHGALAGPKRPHDRVALTHMKKDWESCLSAKVGFKGYGIAKDKLSATAAFDYEGKQYKLHHGSVVIAAVRSQLSCVLLSVAL